MRSFNTAPRSTRRGLLAGTVAAGAGVVFPRWMLAQEATPAPLSEPFVSQTRDDRILRRFRRALSMLAKSPERFSVCPRCVYMMECQEQAAAGALPARGLASIT